MFKVYVLFSVTHYKIYIGYTSDLDKRFISHNEKGRGWTAKFRPWEIIHTEMYSTKAEAIAREKALKSGQGRKWIHEFIIPKQ